MKISDQVATRMFGMTVAQAKAKSKCINCRCDIISESLTEEQLREYTMSAICPRCKELLVGAIVAGRFDEA